MKYVYTDKCDKKEQPQNVISYNQTGYINIDNKIQYSIIIRPTKGKINDERGEQESKNENNENGVEVTTLEGLVHLSTIT